MSKNNLRGERIFSQLGMSHGAAANKLRKSILYKYVTKAQENICYKCDEPIENINEFSIEHKLPWEGRDADLFWDLDNIAFSHLQCNRQHKMSPGGADRRKVGPEDTAWCYKCQKFLSVDSFTQDSTKWNGLRNRCKPCWKEDKQRYALLAQE